MLIVSRFCKKKTKMKNYFNVSNSFRLKATRSNNQFPKLVFYVKERADISRAEFIQLPEDATPSSLEKKKHPLTQYDGEKNTNQMTSGRDENSAKF